MRILILLIIFITLPISALAKITTEACNACWKKCQATHGAVYANKAEMTEKCSGSSDKPLTTASGNLICCHNCANLLNNEIQMEEESVYSEPPTYDSSEAVEPTPSIEELNDRMHELEETVNKLYMNNK